MTNRRTALSGMLGLMALAQAGKSESGPAWPENVFNLQDGTTTHENFGDLTVFLDGHTGELNSMVAGTLLLKPGREPHPPHHHPEEEFMLVTEGEGEFFVGGKTHKVGPGALMYSESNKLHGVKNTSAAPFRFYYFKWAV